MKYFLSGKQVVLRGNRDSDITTITIYRMERVLPRVLGAIVDQS